MMRRLCIVLDTRGYHEGVSSALNDPHWIDAQLDSTWVADALKCEGRKGFIFEIPSSEHISGTKSVKLYESLLVFKHFETRVQVLYKSSQTHKRTIMQQHGWASYIEMYDAFIGGPDLGLDLCESYRFNDNESKAYRLAMRELSDAMPVWPPILEHTDAKKHVLVTSLLDYISSQMSLPRPNAYVLTDLRPSVKELEDGQWILKRNQGYSIAHVKLPPELKSFDKTGRNSLLKGPHPWLAQKYIPLLRDFGEWRCIIIGGRIDRVFFAYPNPNSGQMTTVVTRHFKQLNDISKRLKEGGSRKDIIFDETGSTEIAKEDFFRFVERYLQRLVTAAEGEYRGERSSLRVLCRIDVGLWWHRKETLHYFVRQVKRGTPREVFNGQATTDLHERFFVEFSKWFIYRDSVIY